MAVDFPISIIFNITTKFDMTSSEHSELNTLNIVSLSYIQKYFVNIFLLFDKFSTMTQFIPIESLF